MYSQEYALETLSNLLQNLDYSDDELDEIEKLFELKISMKCECWKDEMVFRTMHSLSKSEKCGSCKKELNVKHLNVPEYLITFDDNQKN